MFSACYASPGLALSLNMHGLIRNILQASAEPPHWVADLAPFCIELPLCSMQISPIRCKNVPFTSTRSTVPDSRSELCDGIGKEFLPSGPLQPCFKLIETLFSTNPRPFGSSPCIHRTFGAMQAPQGLPLFSFLSSSGPSFPILLHGWLPFRFPRDSPIDYPFA